MDYNIRPKLFSFSFFYLWIWLVIFNSSIDTVILYKVYLILDYLNMALSSVSRPPSLKYQNTRTLLLPPLLPFFSPPTKSVHHIIIFMLSIFRMSPGCTSFKVDGRGSPRLFIPTSTTLSPTPGGLPALSLKLLYVYDQREHSQDFPSPPNRTHSVQKPSQSFGFQRGIQSFPGLEAIA